MDHGSTCSAHPGATLRLPHALPRTPAQCEQLPNQDQWINGSKARVINDLAFLLMF
jgi:hypothetical protein